MSLYLFVLLYSQTSICFFNLHFCDMLTYYLFTTICLLVLTFRCSFFFKKIYNCVLSSLLCISHPNQMGINTADFSHLSWTLLVWLLWHCALLGVLRFTTYFIPISFNVSSCFSQHFNIRLIKALVSPSAILGVIQSYGMICLYVVKTPIFSLSDELYNTVIMSQSNGFNIGWQFHNILNLSQTVIFTYYLWPWYIILNN